MAAQGFGMLRKAYVKVMSGTFDYKHWPQSMKAFNRLVILKGVLWDGHLMAEIKEFHLKVLFRNDPKLRKG